MAPPRTYQLLRNNSVLAGDSSSGPHGYLTFLYGQKKYNRGSGRKGTNDKRTIWAWVNSKCKKGSFVTLYFQCICRLTLACICAKLQQATRNANSSFDVFLTADRCRLWTANSFCLSSSLPLDSISCRLVSSAVRGRQPLCVSLRQLPSLGSFFQLVWLLLDLPFLPHFRSRRRSRFQAICLVSRQNRQRDRLLSGPPT